MFKFAIIGVVARVNTGETALAIIGIQKRAHIGRVTFNRAIRINIFAEKQTGHASPANGQPIAGYATHQPHLPSHNAAAEAVALNIMNVENKTPSDAEIIRLNRFL